MLRGGRGLKEDQASVSRVPAVQEVTGRPGKVQHLVDTRNRHLRTLGQDCHGEAAPLAAAQPGRFAHEGEEQGQPPQVTKPETCKAVAAKQACGEVALAQRTHPCIVGLEGIRGRPRQIAHARTGVVGRARQGADPVLDLEGVVFVHQPRPVAGATGGNVACPARKNTDLDQSLGAATITDRPDFVSAPR